MAETIKEAAFYCISGRAFHHVLLRFTQCNIENLFVEINLRKRKWFLNCSYNPHRNLISSHLECLHHVIDEHSKTYDNFIFIGDFNLGIDEKKFDQSTNVFEKP